MPNRALGKVVIIMKIVKLVMYEFGEIGEINIIKGVGYKWEM